MSTKSQILEILHGRDAEYISGQELASTLGLSRNSIWKAIGKLQDEGFEIESRAGVGYRLVQKGDVLSASCIRDAVNIPCKVHILDSVDSTNNYAKTLGDVTIPNIIIANE